MTQPAPRDAAGTPTRVITVADLLTRCRPALPAPGPRTAAVPVATLLQREGRPSPTAGGTELEVTEYREDDHDEAPPRRGPSASVVKRSAVAAGVLLVAGSLVGAAVATTDAPAAATTSGDERTPERPWLDPVPALPGLGPAVSTGALDPGAAPDEPWLDVAFPPGSTGSPAPDRAASTGGGSADTPVDRTEDRGGSTPPAGGAGGDAGADDPDEDSPDERPRDDGGNGNGNGNGGGKGKGDDKGSGDPDGGDGSAGLVGDLLGVVTDVL